MIEIYGKTFCPYCDKAKALCERESYEYSYKQLDKDFTREEMLEAFPTAKTYPQIKINNTHIGTYTQMVTYIETMDYK